MLSERDCLQIAMVAAQDTCVAGPISQYMSTRLETVSSDMSLAQLAGLFMTNSHFRRYPVVDDGKLVGQISRSDRSEEHTSELQSLMRISYAVFCLKKKTINHYSSRDH